MNEVGSKLEIARNLVLTDKYFVFPVHNIKDGVCTCNKPKCFSPGKHPMTPHGHLDASNDLNKIDYWWSKDPEANIGIACEPSGLVVVDVDGPAGLTEFIKSSGVHPDIIDTKVVKTGSGWYHIYYDAVDSTITSRADIVEDLDCRARGGYVLAQGSDHTDGKYELLNKHSTKPIPSTVASLLKSSPVNDGIVEELEPIERGNRNVMLTREAGKLTKLYDPFTAFRMLEAFNQLNVKPPVTPRELQGIIKSITNRENNKDKPVEVKELSLSNLMPFETFMNTYNSTEDLWLIDKWLEQGAFCVVGSPPGHYKSWLGFSLCACIGGSGPFLGLYPAVETGPVLLIDQEDNPYDMASRFMAILNTTGDPNKIKDYINPNLMIYTGKDINIRDPKSIDFIEKTVKEYGIITVVIDPFYSILGATENHYNDVTTYILALKEIRDRYNCAFVFNHHTTKSLGEGRARDSFFGGNLFQATLEQSWAIKLHNDGAVGNPILQIIKTTKYGEIPKDIYLELMWDSGFYAKEYTNPESIPTNIGVAEGYKQITETNMREVLLKGPAFGSPMSWIRGHYTEHVATNTLISFMVDLVGKGIVKENGDLFTLSTNRVDPNDLVKEIAMLTGQMSEARDSGDINSIANIASKLRLLKTQADKIIKTF